MTLHAAARLWLVLSLVVLLPIVGSGVARAQVDPAVREVEVARNAFTLAAPVPDWVVPVAVAPLAGPASNRFLLRDTQLRVDAEPAAHVHIALVAADVGALQAAGQQQIHFVPDYQRLHLHYVRLLRGAERLDRTASTSIRFLQRETGLERGIYSGVVTAALVIDDLRIGDVVEYAYTIRGGNPVFAGRYADAVSWGDPQPIAHRHVVLDHPADRDIAWRFIARDGTVAPQPREELRDGRRRLVFEARDLGPVLAEPAVPPDVPVVPWLQVSEYRSWADVARWAESLFAAVEPADPVLVALAGRLRDLPDARARVAAALAHVQSEVRYFSVSLGASSHRPAPPGTVLARRYGDCKDKSLLLIALLRALGIEAHPVLLDLGRTSDLAAILPSPSAFDHVIVQVRLDGEVFHLDPTLLGQDGPLDRLGQPHAGAQVLVLDGAADAAPSRIAWGAQDEVDVALRETIAVPRFDADGMLESRFTWTGLGAEFARLRVASVPRDMLARFLAQGVQGRYSGAELVGLPELEDDRAANRLTLAIRVRVPRPAQAFGQDWVVRFLPETLRDELPPGPAPGRALPLFLGRLRVVEYSVAVTFPDEVREQSDPVQTRIETPSLSYVAAHGFRGNRFTSEMTLRILTDRVAPPDLAAFADTRQAVLRDIRTVAVARGDAIVRPPGDAAPASTAELVRTRLRGTVDVLGTAIATGRLGSRDLVEARCRRATTLADLGELEEAMREADAVVRLAPELANAVSCRGEVLFVSGRFDRAAEAFRRATLLGAAGGRTWTWRGLAEFYAGDLEAAAEDFATALERDDPSNRAYTELWLAWTLRRLDRPLPPALLARAAEGRTAAWPRPALAMVAGLLPPEQVIGQFDAAKGEEQALGLAEAFFYAGQHALQEGRTAEARRLFEACRAFGVLNFIEHVAAGFELARMPPP